MTASAPASAPPSHVPIAPQAAARWQQRSHTQSPWLHEEIARRMMQRLDFITLQPRNWLHWHAAQGGLQAHTALQQRYPQATAWHAPAANVTSSTASSATDTAVATSPPPAAHSIDMLWANMALHTATDPLAVLKQWRQWLSPTGFVMFSTLGPDTLHELRQLYQQRGWPPPCHSFTDMHDWGDMLLQAGFADPVIDTERITLTFTSHQRLLQELRELGRNLAASRSHATHSHGWLAELHQAISTLAQADGSLPLTFEVIYGHAVQSSQSSDETGATTIDLVHMRHMLRNWRG